MMIMKIDEQVMILQNLIFTEAFSKESYFFHMLLVEIKIRNNVGRNELMMIKTLFCDETQK